MAPKETQKKKHRNLNDSWMGSSRLRTAVKDHRCTKDTAWEASLGSSILLQGTSTGSAGLQEQIKEPQLDPMNAQPFSSLVYAPKRMDLQKLSEL